MYYNEYYRPRTNKTRNILIVILIIVSFVLLGIGGYLLATKIIFADKSYEHLSELVVEKEYKSKDGKIYEKYSYIEVSEKEIDVTDLRDWCENYVTSNFDDFDKFIIKYKGNKDNKGVIVVMPNYINVDCTIVEHKDGKIEYEYSDDEYSVTFNEDVITKYVHDKEKDELLFYDWNPEKGDWGSPGKV